MQAILGYHQGSIDLMILLNEKRQGTKAVKHILWTCKALGEFFSNSSNSRILLLVRWKLKT